MVISQLRGILLLFILSLFHVNNVYAASDFAKDDDPDNDPFYKPLSKKNDKTNANNAYRGINRAKDDDPDNDPFYNPLKSDNTKKNDNYIIEPTLYFFDKYNPYYSTYVFSMINESNNKLKFPNELQYIKFCGKLLVFDKTARLSDCDSFSSLSIYTTKSNNPVLIRMRTSLGYVFYSPDPKTLKWTNYRVDRLNKVAKLDKNGILNYKFDLSVDYDYVFGSVAEECAELTQKWCRYNRCDEVEVGGNPSVELGIKLAHPRRKLHDDIMSQIKRDGANSVQKQDKKSKDTRVVSFDQQENVVISPSFSYYTKRNGKYSLYSYYIDSYNRDLLIYPNKIQRITFNNEVLEFSSSVTMPSYPNFQLFGVTTCDHNVPVLIRILSLNQFFFYSRDPKTNKWNNHRIPTLKSYELEDENGTVYYQFGAGDNFINFYSKLSDESQRLSELNYAYHDGIKRIISGNPQLEIEIKKFKPTTVGDLLVAVSKSESEPVVEEEVLSSEGNNLLIKGQLYYTATALKQRLANQFTLLLGTLGDENIKNVHEEFVKDMRKEFQRIESRINKSFSKFNVQEERDGWIGVLPKISYRLSGMKKLIDEVHNKIQATFEDPEIKKIFAYDVTVYKSQNLAYFLNNLKFILENIGKDSSDVDVEVEVQEFDNSKLNFENLMEQLLEQQDAEKQDEQFKSMLAEVNKATEAFKKVLDSAVNKEDDKALKASDKFSSNVASFIDGIANVSRSFMPGLFAMILSGLTLILI